MNNNIYEFFNSNRIEDLDNEYGFKFKFNIYAYSHQLDYFMNHFRNLILRGNELELWNPLIISETNLLHENTKLENDIIQFPFQGYGYKDNMTVSTAISTPNTVEYELLFLQKSYYNEFEKVKMENFIYTMFK
jgi:hypothetical protein